MNISLSRRYVQGAYRRLNVDRLRVLSTTASISSNRDVSRVWSESLSFASPAADFVFSPGKKNLSTYIQHDGSVWSNSLSFASPESDSVSASKTEHLREYATDSKPYWSESLSFASPESDFVSASQVVHNASSAVNDEWSGSLSFASPESDFVSAPQEVHNTAATVKDKWSETLSFSSAESDFTSASQEVHNLRTTVSEKWSESLSFASPESDFVSVPKAAHMIDSDAQSSARVDSVLEQLFRTQHLYHSPETATGFIPYAEMIDESIVQALVKDLSLKATLPKTLDDALNDERPIVITTTESPFCVVDVNSAWEGLCGYDREEAIGRNIGSLLQGPLTNIESANAMIRALRENGVSESVLTNYTKEGRSFENRIQVGMIQTNDAKTASNDFYLVGVLQDISDNSNHQAVAAM